MVDEPDITVQAAPPDIGTQEVAPKKRGPGRPKGSKNKTTTTGRKRGRRRKSLEDKIGGTLMMLNMAFAFAPEEFRGDALDTVEISALAKALDEAARENDQLYGYIDAVLGGSGSAVLNLAVVGGCIAARRMARHGVYVSEDWDTRLGAFIGMTAGMDTAGVSEAIVRDALNDATE